jgi:hypothetical protein
VNARDVVCPKCRAPAGEPCRASEAPHRERTLAAAALARMPEAREDDTPEARATRAARQRQQARAKDPRMDNDW